MNYLTGLLVCTLVTAGFAETNCLTLEDALSLARQYSPELRAAQAGQRAAEQAVHAAGLWRNPVFEFEAEGIGGDLNGLDRTEYSILLQQSFQRGGKRALERDAALRAADAARHARAMSGAELLAAVRRAFIELLSLQDTAVVRTQQEQLARALVELAKRRHEAGSASELDVLQAGLALENVRLEQTCCFGELKAARIRLASLIGIPEDDLPERAGPYDELDPVETVLFPDSHPALQKMDSEIEQVRAEASRLRAADRADLTLAAGVKHDSTDSDSTFVLGVSMPVTLVRHGRAAEAAKLIELEARVAAREEVFRGCQQALSSSIAQYEGTQREMEILESNLLPKAQEAYELTRKGYETGRFSWVEVIAAQQHLAGIRIRLIDALRNARLIRAEIETLIHKEF